MTHADTSVFPVTVVATAAPEGRLACRISSGMRAPFVDDWSLATDEPRTQGGSGEAPPPLVLLGGALASCLSVQVRAFARRRRLDLPPASVEVAIDWTGHHRAPVYRAEGRSVTAIVRLDTDDAPEAWTAHVTEAIEGCFVEALLSDRLTILHRVATRTGEAAI
jgi:uncharacterized OsmC-like protein